MRWPKFKSVRYSVIETLNASFGALSSGDILWVALLMPDILLQARLDLGA